MSEIQIRPLSLSVEGVDGGQDRNIIINGMSVGANVVRDSIQVEWDRERRLPKVTLTFFVDEFTTKGGWSGMVPSGSGLTTTGGRVNGSNMVGNGAVTIHATTSASDALADAVDRAPGGAINEWEKGA